MKNADPFRINFIDLSADVKSFTCSLGQCKKTANIILQTPKMNLKSGQLKIKSRGLCQRHGVELKVKSEYVP